MTSGVPSRMAVYRAKQGLGQRFDAEQRRLETSIRPDEQAVAYMVAALPPATASDQERRSSR